MLSVPHDGNLSPARVARQRPALKTHLPRSGPFGQIAVEGWRRAGLMSLDGLAHRLSHFLHPLNRIARRHQGYQTENPSEVRRLLLSLRGHGLNSRRAALPDHELPITRA